MKPYGMNIKNSPKTHSHNVCSICRAYPPTRGQARLSEKSRLQEEFIFVDLWWDEKEGEALQDVFIQSGFYGEVDEDYIKFG